MTKSEVLQLRLEPWQKTEIKRRADKNGKKVSQFLLDLALQGVDPPPDESAIEDPSQFPAMAALADLSGDDTPDAEDLRPEEPTREEVDALALTIHNTEGLPMRAALAAALHRLSS